MKKTSLQGIAILAGLFLLGGVFGASMTIVAVRNNPSLAFRPGGPGKGPPSHDKIARMVETELVGDIQLTADQKHAIDAEFDQLHNDFEALQDEYRPRLDGLMDDLRTRVLTHLNPEQQSDFNQAFEKWKQHRPPNMPPPGPPMNKPGGPPPMKPWPGDDKGRNGEGGK